MEERRFDVVNHETPRLESFEKALGSGKYTDDLSVPGMVYAELVRSPYSHAKVLSIDTSEAEKVPGYSRINPGISWLSFSEVSNL